MEGKSAWHGKTIGDQEYEAAMAELGAEESCAMQSLAAVSYTHLSNWRNQLKGRTGRPDWYIYRSVPGVNDKERTEQQWNQFILAAGVYWGNHPVCSGVGQL